MSPVLIIFFGAPASGKTTLCKQLRHVLQDKPIISIEFDSFENDAKSDARKSDGQFDVNVWKQGRRSALLKVTTVLEDSKQSLDEPTLLLDDTFHLRSMRKEVYRLGSQCKL